VQVLLIFSCNCMSTAATAFPSHLVGNVHDACISPALQSASAVLCPEGSAGAWRRAARACASPLNPNRLLVNKQLRHRQPSHPLAPHSTSFQIHANRSLVFLSPPTTSCPPLTHCLPNYPAALLDAAAAVTLNPLYAKAWYRLGSGTLALELK
jgi:hypothetical protein